MGELAQGRSKKNMRVLLDTKTCIACGSCAAVCPKFFELKEKSHLKKSKLNGKTEELEVKELDCIKQAADICPTQSIQYEDKS